MKKKYAISAFVFMVICLAIACVKNKIDFVNGSQISGQLTYEDIVSGKKAAPAGTKVSVFFEKNTTPASTFLTTDSGKYVFTPQSKGSYRLTFSVVDTVLNYDAALIQKADIDSTRKSASHVVFYNKTAKDITASVSDDKSIYTVDVDLTAVETGLKLLVNDSKGNPIPGARVCLYSNQTFASQNAPNCGGCLVYLSTDVNGQIVFTGITPGTYYINARADVGVIHLNNQFSGSVKSAAVATSGNISQATVVLQ